MRSAVKPAPLVIGVPPLLVYDGACGFCCAAVALLQRLEPGVAMVARQALDDGQLAALGTSREQCRRETVFVRAPGDAAGGADAVNAALERTAFAPFVAVVRRLPALLALEHRVYRAVAARRSELSALLGTARFREYPLDGPEPARSLRR